jgi:hypothetical protein
MSKLHTNEMVVELGALKNDVNLVRILVKLS